MKLELLTIPELERLKEFQQARLVDPENRVLISWELRDNRIIKNRITKILDLIIERQDEIMELIDADVNPPTLP